LGYDIEKKSYDMAPEVSVDREELLRKLEGYKERLESGDIDMGFEHLNRYIGINLNKFIQKLKLS